MEDGRATDLTSSGDADPPKEKEGSMYGRSKAHSARNPKLCNSEVDENHAGIKNK